MRPVALLPAGLLLVGCGQEASVTPEPQPSIGQIGRRTLDDLSRAAAAAVGAALDPRKVSR